MTGRAGRSHRPAPDASGAELTAALTKSKRKRGTPPYVEPFRSCGMNGCCSGWVETAKGAVRCWCWLQFMERVKVDADSTL